MIKRFEQYLKEKLEIKDSFKFSDNFQALFDMFENDIDVSATDGDILFKLPIPYSSLEELKAFNNNLTQFTNELSTIMESISAENIKHSIQISGRVSEFCIRILISTDSDKFKYEIIESELNNLEEGYDISYYVTKNYSLNDYNWVSVYDNFFDDASSNEYKFIKLKISSNTQYAVETEKIDEIVSRAIGNTFVVVDTNLYDADDIDEDDQDFQFYEIYIERKNDKKI